MFVKSQNTAVFSGTPTSNEERKVLQYAGFVHVTGLQTYDNTGKEKYAIGELITENCLGKWSHNNGHTVVVTTGGETWLRVGDPDDGSIEEVKKMFAPNGRGAFVPCSNGEKVGESQLLARVANPNYNFVVQAK